MLINSHGTYLFEDIIIHIYALIITDTFRTKIKYDSWVYNQGYPRKICDHYVHSAVGDISSNTVF